MWSLVFYAEDISMYYYAVLHQEKCIIIKITPPPFQTLLFLQL